MNRLASAIANIEQEFELAIQAAVNVHESDLVDIHYWCFAIKIVDQLSMEHQLKSEIKSNE